MSLRRRGSLFTISPPSNVLTCHNMFKHISILPFNPSWHIAVRSGSYFEVMGSNLGPETGYDARLCLFHGSLQANTRIVPQVRCVIASFHILSSSLLTDYHTIRCYAARKNKQINCHVVRSLSYCRLIFSMHFACHMRAACLTHLIGRRVQLPGAQEMSNRSCTGPQRAGFLGSDASPR
jgi:hypothetical protein